MTGSLSWDHDLSHGWETGKNVKESEKDTTTYVASEWVANARPDFALMGHEEQT